ncbi:hypothetical protein MD484_g4862, partial [Candolleomyces efflorescens]
MTQPQISFPTHSFHDGIERALTIFEEPFVVFALVFAELGKVSVLVKPI